MRPLRWIRSRCARIGLPEDGLVDPVRLLRHPLGEPEGLEHLHRAARDPIGLPDLQGTVPLIDDAHRDIRKGGKLGGEGQPGRTATDDQNVDLRRKQARRGAWRQGVLGPSDRRIAGTKAVEVELHGLQDLRSPCRRAVSPLTPTSAPTSSGKAPRRDPRPQPTQARRSTVVREITTTDGDHEILPVRRCTKRPAARPSDCPPAHSAPLERGARRTSAGALRRAHDHQRQRPPARALQ